MEEKTFIFALYPFRFFLSIPFPNEQKNGSHSKNCYKSAGKKPKMIIYNSEGVCYNKCRPVDEVCLFIQEIC